jgi:hypothetical protein
VAHTIGIVGVFIAGDNLIEALPQKRPRVMPESVLLSPITEDSGPIMAQMMTLIKSPQREQTGVAGDLATGEIGTDGLMMIEGKVQLWQNTLYQVMMLRKARTGRVCGSPSISEIPESAVTERQYALRSRAIALGWRDDQILVIDNDQGGSGASAA